MATFTLNSGTTVNFDAQSGGSTNNTLDTYTISAGTTLEIDTDTYACANHSAAFGSFDNLGFSGIGGKVKIDGTRVRVIPYDTGTGNVPAIGTSITQGAVSAVLLGVWASWIVEPTAAGSAMPATGYIKVKTKTGGDFAAGALTGIGASATGPDVTGWIEVRSPETATLTVPRVGTFEAVGDWFYLDNTTGVRGQVIPCPTVGQYSNPFPASTAVAVNYPIYTSAGRLYYVNVAGTTGASEPTHTSGAVANGTATITYIGPRRDGAFPGVQIETAPGSGVYEWYASVGTLAAASTIPTDADRGKICWFTNSGVRIGSDGTNNVGYLPASGCKVRIPNIILTNCARTANVTLGGSGIRVIPNATLASRAEFATTGAGAITLTNCVVGWYLNLSQAYSVSLVDCAVSDTIAPSEISTAITLTRVLVAPTQLQSNYTYNIVSCFAGGNITDCFFVRATLASSSNYVGLANYSTGVTFTNCVLQTLANRANAATGVHSSVQVSSFTFSGCKAIGGRFIFTTSDNVTLTNTAYIDNFTGTTGTGNPMSVADFGIGCLDCLVDGITMPVTNNHPYTSILQISASKRITLRNVGSKASHLSLGSANQTSVIVSSSGNNSDINVKRCYTLNTRTGIHSFANSDNRVVMESVFGDYADAPVFPQLNSLVKGGGHTTATTGQLSTYGMHWVDEFTAATTGRIVALLNEPTVATAAQCYIVSGTPVFNSSGQIAMTVVGQQIIMEMPYFAIGHTATANVAPTLTGTSTGNLTYEFQVDKGTGYSGTWSTLNQTNWNAVGAITASIGIKVKLRITCAVANAGNLLTCVRLDTVSTLTAQTDNLYPLTTNTLTLTGLIAGTEIHAYLGTDPATATELASTESSSTSFAFTHSAGGSAGYITLIKPGQKFLRISLTYSSSDTSFPVFQVADRDYSNP